MPPKRKGTVLPEESTENNTQDEIESNAQVSDWSKETEEQVSSTEDQQPQDQQTTTSQDQTTSILDFDRTSVNSLEEVLAPYTSIDILKTLLKRAETTQDNDLEFGCKKTLQRLAGESMRKPRKRNRNRNNNDNNNSNFSYPVQYTQFTPQPPFHQQYYYAYPQQYPQSFQPNYRNSGNTGNSGNTDNSGNSNSNNDDTSVQYNNFRGRNNTRGKGRNNRYYKPVIDTAETTQDTQTSTNNTNMYSTSNAPSLLNTTSLSTPSNSFRGRRGKYNNKN